jgi:predicted negative regulator of RcsB-dependent stress response
MAAYDLEEQERLAAVKDWWEKWGNLVYAAVIAFLIGLGGTQAWRYYQKKQAVEAEALFASVQKVAQESAATKEWKKLADSANALTEKFPSTFYATDTQLMAAKAAFDAREYATARKHLEWVIASGRKSHVSVARIRLAAVHLDEKNYAEALKVLDQVTEEGFLSLAADLRGDVFAVQGKRDEARAAYQLAVEKADARSPQKAISQVKLDAFGGTDKLAEAKPADAKAESGAKK